MDRNLIEHIARRFAEHKNDTRDQLGALRKENAVMRSQINELRSDIGILRMQIPPRIVPATEKEKRHG